MENNPFVLKLYIKILFILLSSGLLITSFYDDFFFVSWVCLVPFFIVLSFSGPGQSVLFSWVTGILFFAGVTRWFTEYSFIYWLPVIGVLSLYFLFYGTVFYFVYSRIRWPFLRIFLISSLWIAGEYLRQRTFLAFPWGVLGYTQHNFLQLMQLTKVTGILGVTLLIIVLNISIAGIITDYLVEKPGIGGSLSWHKDKGVNNFKSKAYQQNRSVKKIKVLLPVIITAAVTLIIIFSGSVYMHTRGTGYKGSKINVALVQTNISFDDKYQKDTAVLIPEPYSKSYFFKEDTELVVFPESVIWGHIERGKNTNFKKWVEDTAVNENLYFIMGQIVWDEEENYFNVVQLYNPSMAITGRYNKVHPLPCGEYMPYPDILGFLSFLNIAKLNITPADEFFIIDYPGKGKIGTNICFESTIPSISRIFRQMGAGLLFTFTDDAGFKDSIASWHHLIFSRVRAIENGCFLVHIGNNGISAIIDPTGMITVKSRLLEKEVIYGTAYFINTGTFYTAFGEIIIFVYWGVSFILLVFYLIRMKTSKRS